MNHRVSRIVDKEKCTWSGNKRTNMSAPTNAAGPSCAYRRTIEIMMRKGADHRLWSCWHTCCKDSVSVEIKLVILPEANFLPLSLVGHKDIRKTAAISVDLNPKHIRMTFWKYCASARTPVPRWIAFLHRLPCHEETGTSKVLVFEARHSNIFSGIGYIKFQSHLSCLISRYPYLWWASCILVASEESSVRKIFLVGCKSFCSLTRKYVGMPLRNLSTSWKRFIISIVYHHLIPYWSITRVWIQARKIKQHENSKQELAYNLAAV
jgi:hypothetical protein